MAQGRRGGGARGSFQLLSISEVQKELKLTPDEISKIEDKRQSVQQDSRSAMQDAGNPQDLSAEDRQKLMSKIEGINDKAASDVLDAAQLKRFHQLVLQQQGGTALARPEIQDQLKFTDDQKKQVADIQRQGNDDMAAARSGVDFQSMSPEDRTKLFTKMTDIQKATGDKLIGILTDDQKLQWKVMTGDPFTFPAMPMGGPGGGRRGGAPGA